MSCVPRRPDGSFIPVKCYQDRSNAQFPLPSMASTPRNSTPGGGRGREPNWRRFEVVDIAKEEHRRKLQPLLLCFTLSTCRPPPESPSRTARLKKVESQLREGERRTGISTECHLAGTFRRTHPRSLAPFGEPAHNRCHEVVSVTCFDHGSPAAPCVHCRQPQTSQRKTADASHNAHKSISKR